MEEISNYFVILRWAEVGGQVIRTGRLPACVLSYEDVWDLTVKYDAMYTSKLEGRILSKMPSIAAVTERLWQKKGTVVPSTGGKIPTATNRSTGRTKKSCRNGTLSSTDGPASAIQIYRRRNVHAVPGCSEISISFCYVK